MPTRFTPALLLCLGLALLPACSSLSPRPALTVEQYTLDYPPPAPQAAPPLPAGLKVARFTTTQELNATDMLHQTGPASRGVYNYHRWRVTPADLVTDLLTRDARAAAAFAAVLPWQSGSTLRFKLEGALEECLERSGPQGPQALLRLSVSLLDLTHRDFPARLLFQRTYQEAEPMPASSPETQAQALSAALQRLSARVLDDARQAVKGRLGE